MTAPTINESAGHVSGAGDSLNPIAAHDNTGPVIVRPNGLRVAPTINEGGQDGEEAERSAVESPTPPSPDDYPTIALLANLSRGTVGYQEHGLRAEAVRCWHALRRERERAERAEAALRERNEHPDKGYWMAECEYARAERDALRADAERYRWLRAAQSQTARSWIVINNRSIYGEHELDAAIDAARK